MTQISLSGHIPTEQPARTDIVKLSFKLNSIILLVGPDSSGKTQFAMEQLMLQLKMAQTGKKNIKISYISIDQILAQLLDNYSFVKDSIEAEQVMEQANSILFSQLKGYTDYPVNSDFVIVDSTGLDSVFRKEILKIGEENHYNVSAVVFNYADKAEYYTIDEQSGEKQKPIPSQMKQFKQVVSGGISKKEFPSIQTIVDRVFDRYEISVEDYLQYDQYILPEDKDYIIFGDIHGCYDEFILLLKKHGFSIDENLKVTHPGNKAILLVGDIIDKGYGIKEMIELAYANLDTFYMVAGNHENFVYKTLKKIYKKGEIATPEVRKEFFNTIELLGERIAPKEPVAPVEVSALSEHKYAKEIQEYNNLMSEFIPFSEEEKVEIGVLREKFFAVFESMKSFYVHKEFIVTHAPCEKKYLGKITTEALKATRDYRYPKRRDFEVFAEYIVKFDERAKFLKEEARDLHPLHVFGHVMTKEVSVFKNKVAIDTGCVSGGELTSMRLYRHYDALNVFFESISAGNKIKNNKEQLHNFFN